jgi:aldose 1-epimerase
VEYTIGRRELGIEIRATNVGETTAPYASGWHPYFTLSRPRPIDDLVLQIPAHTLIRTDASLIPLPGKEALLPLDRCPDMDFRTPRRLGDAVIDACFADLAPGPDGRTETVLSDPATGDDYGCGSTAATCTCSPATPWPATGAPPSPWNPSRRPTDAFNRPEHAAALSLEPGRQREFRQTFGVSVLAHG